MFDGINYWGFGLRIVILYMIVLIALRVMGKREIGQLSVFDFVVSVMIAELSTLPMEDVGVPLVRSFFAIAILVVLQLLVAIISLRSHWFRHLVEGEATVLIEHGQIKDNEMRKTRYSMHDLVMQLRQKGYANVADVEFAILETSGDLSVFPVAEKRPLTPQDVGVAVQHEKIPLPLIVDGNLVQKTLQTLKRSKTWVTEELHTRGYGDLSDIFYASIDADGTIQIDPRDPPANATQPKVQPGKPLAQSDGKRKGRHNGGQPSANARNASNGVRGHHAKRATERKVESKADGDQSQQVPASDVSARSQRVHQDEHRQ